MPLPGVNRDDAGPQLSQSGICMAERLPEALRRHDLTRIVSSPQLRAQQTAEPLAEALNLRIEIDERLAEYDYGLSEYVPVEQMRAENPQKLARLVAGQLPEGVDVDAFKVRVLAAVNQLTASSERRDRVAVVSHGGVINVVLQRALGTPRLFPFPIDYVSVSHLRYSGEGKLTVLGVNNIEHVWDLLPELDRR